MLRRVLVFVSVGFPEDIPEQEYLLLKMQAQRKTVGLSLYVNLLTRSGTTLADFLYISILHPVISQTSLTPFGVHQPFLKAILPSVVAQLPFCIGTNLALMYHSLPLDSLFLEP